MSTTVIVEDISLQLGRTQVSTDNKTNQLVVSRPVGSVLAYITIDNSPSYNTMLAIMTKLHRLVSLTDEQFLLFHNTQRKVEQVEIESEGNDDDN